MVIIKSLFLAGFMLACALASEDKKPKPAMAALLVQSNFDFSLTKKEFRVHYSGLGDEFKSVSEPTSVSIKIYRPDEQEVLSYDVTGDKKTRKAYQFALDDVQDGTYKVEVCADSVCSGKTSSVTDVLIDEKKKISCMRGQMVGGKWKPAAVPTFELDLVGPSDQAWAKQEDYTKFENKINVVRKALGLDDYQTDYSKHGLDANPTYTKDKIFYTAFKYDLTKYAKLFDKHQGKTERRTEYSHDFCERKYLLSAHAHLVNKVTKEVEHRFKTTLFLSEGGKKMFALGTEGEEVIVEITHEGVQIPNGEYKLLVSLCATEKDAIESTFCSDPITNYLTVA